MVVTSSSWAPTPTFHHHPNISSYSVYPGISPLVDQNHHALVCRVKIEARPEVCFTVFQIIPNSDYHKSALVDLAPKCNSKHTVYPCLLPAHVFTSTSFIHLTHYDVTALSMKSWELSLHTWLWHTKQFVPRKVQHLLAAAFGGALSDSVDLTDFNNVVCGTMGLELSPLGRHLKTATSRICRQPVVQQGQEGPISPSLIYG